MCVACSPLMEETDRCVYCLGIHIMGIDLHHIARSIP
jgi:hypothetical protein